ncbi:MAG: hypothetical protein IKP44_00895, partial [Bacteroidaceae bacterium]|nr:hypothetical protein [Bacteroidaceae bacterium]
FDNLTSKALWESTYFSTRQCNSVHNSPSSIPYCPQIHCAALSGMSFAVGITPSSARKDVFWLSHG